MYLIQIEKHIPSIKSCLGTGKAICCIEIREHCENKGAKQNGNVHFDYIKVVPFVWQRCGLYD